MDVYIEGIENLTPTRMGKYAMTPRMLLKMPSYGLESGECSPNRKPRSAQMPIWMPFTKQIWPYIPTHLTRLELDLFWPGISSEPQPNDVFPPEYLAPLTSLRQLRVLKIVGMLDSYQKYIWQTAWLCPYLEEVALEMALEPVVRSIVNKKWPTIKGSWQMKDASMAKLAYIGDGGKGTLRYELGCGEYLDLITMGEAQKLAMEKGLVSELFTIRKLSLTGFVVDAHPFKRWFDPERLQELNFKNDCIDAGFVLSSPMRERVRITFPSKSVFQSTSATVVNAGTAKIVRTKWRATAFSELKKAIEIIRKE